jgi:hypothetical protein
MVEVTDMQEGIGIHLLIPDIDGEQAIGDATIKMERNGFVEAGEEDKNCAASGTNIKVYFAPIKQSIKDPLLQRVFYIRFFSLMLVLF